MHVCVQAGGRGRGITASFQEGGREGRVVLKNGYSTCRSGTLPSAPPRTPPIASFLPLALVSARLRCILAPPGGPQREQLRNPAGGDH